MDNEEHDPLEGFNPDDETDMDAEVKVTDIEQFMLKLHEFAFWNVELSYVGMPVEFKPIYIALRMQREPVDIEVLEKHLPAADVSEIVKQHVILKGDSMYITENIKVDIVEHLSKRMDYFNKMKLVDQGLADMCWDAEKGEPVFTMKDQEGPPNVPEEEE